MRDFKCSGKCCNQADFGFLKMRASQVKGIYPISTLSRLPLILLLDKIIFASRRVCIGFCRSTSALDAVSAHCSRGSTRRDRPAAHRLNDIPFYPVVFGRRQANKIEQTTKQPRRWAGLSARRQRPWGIWGRVGLSNSLVTPQSRLVQSSVRNQSHRREISRTDRLDQVRGAKQTYVP